MEELTGKFYDLVTKQEVPREKIEPYKIYLYIEDNYCGKARMVTFDTKGIIIDSTYISYREKLNMLIEVIKLKYINLGNTNVKVELEDMISLDGIQINIPHISVTYINVKGKIVQGMINENTMESMIHMDEHGNVTIEVNNAYIGNDDNKSKIREDFKTSQKQEKRKQSLISFNSNSNSNFEINFKDNEFSNIDIAGLQNVTQMPGWKVSIDQFGFTGKYDLSNPEDMERFKTDMKEMPKNSKEAQKKEEGKTRKEEEEVRGN